ncbi:phosphohydrolase, partial [Pseudomonas soli]|nr:phosphohydrolase [Pseudomonas soli]
MSKQASFSHMRDGTAQDWAIIADDFRAYAQQLPQPHLAHLRLLQGPLGRYPIHRLSHSLQTPTP